LEKIRKTLDNGDTPGSIGTFAVSYSGAVLAGEEENKTAMGRAVRPTADVESTAPR
jgi:hypothetical protein